MWCRLQAKLAETYRDHGHAQRLALAGFGPLLQQFAHVEAATVYVRGEDLRLFPLLNGEGCC